MHKEAVLHNSDNYHYIRHQGHCYTTEVPRGFLPRMVLHNKIALNSLSTEQAASSLCHGKYALWYVDLHLRFHSKYKKLTNHLAETG